MLRQDGRAIPLEPVELRREVGEGLRLIRDRHTGKALEPAAAAVPPEHDGVGERPPGPVAPERFAVLQSLLAYLLKSCGDAPSATIAAAELVERFHIPEDELQEHLSLLNLVNFGGGCYAVYAQLDGDQVRVDKEIWGDSFREPPRLTPLEARAIRLALEFVGPAIAADAHTPLDRVRRKLEETFGEFELAQTPEPHGGSEEKLISTFQSAIESQQLVEIEYLKEGEEEPYKRLVEPYSFMRELPGVADPHLGPDGRRPADVPPRPDALRPSDQREVRAEVRLRSELPEQQPDREGLVLAADRTLAGRARAAARPSPRRRRRPRRGPCRKP